jgi:hypothetical protein
MSAADDDDGSTAGRCEIRASPLTDYRLRVTLGDFLFQLYFLVRPRVRSNIYHALSFGCRGHLVFRQTTLTCWRPHLSRVSFAVKKELFGPQRGQVERVCVKSGTGADQTQRYPPRLRASRHQLPSRTISAIISSSPIRPRALSDHTNQATFDRRLSSNLRMTT